MAFEERGFCVVRGPDTITGGDIRNFHPLAGVFGGVIGGPPCQEFSQLNRGKKTGYGLDMLGEFVRIVVATQPEWWLLENVATVPDVKIDSYSWQRFELDLAWYSDYSRLRHFQFGSKSGVLLDPPTGKRSINIKGGAVLATDDRGFDQMRAIQGLPSDFDLPSFNVSGKKRAVGNGVPLALGRVLADLICNVTHRCCNDVTRWRQENVTAQESKNVTLRNAKTVTARALKSVMGPGKKNVTCACGCGRKVYGRALTASAACRKRVQRNRR